METYAVSIILITISVAGYFLYRLNIKSQKLSKEKDELVNRLMKIETDLEAQYRTQVNLEMRQLKADLEIKKTEEVEQLRIYFNNELNDICEQWKKEQYEDLRNSFKVYYEDFFNEKLKEETEKLERRRYDVEAECRERCDIEIEKNKTWYERKVQEELTKLNAEFIASLESKMKDWEDGKKQNIEEEIKKSANQQYENRLKEIIFNKEAEIKEKEEDIRKDAIEKSKRVTHGKVIEHFVPFLPTFKYDPRDAKFLGQPIDFVVFDGMSVEDIKEIVLIEIKTGKSKMNNRQRQIEKAINENKIRFELIEVEDKIKDLFV